MNDPWHPALFVAAAVAISVAGLVISIVAPIRRTKKLRAVAASLGFELTEQQTPEAFRAFLLDETPEQLRAKLEAEALRDVTDHTLRAMLRNEVEKLIREGIDPLRRTALRDLELMRRGNTREARNIMTGRRDGVDIIVFDYVYGTGTQHRSWTRQTVAAVKRSRPVESGRRSGFTIEANGPIAIAYKWGRKVAPTRIAAFVDEALALTTSPRRD